MTHQYQKRSFVPQAVLTKLGKLSTTGAAVNTVKTVNTANTKAVNIVRSVNTAASKPIVNHPRTKTNAFKRGYSQSLRPFNRHFANKNSIINTNVNTARVKHTTARDRVVVSEHKGKGANAVKALACWGNQQQKEYKEKGVIDSGCSRHMTGNKCYIDELNDYAGGCVSFCDGKGRISGKGKIKTGSLDFDDVYFCKELSITYLLLDESQVLLRVPRKDNIYSIDLKSVVPTRGLTCIIAKATIDEYNTWHKRLGHINFKTMNKLVKGNLVKGLPSKIFKNDHSYVDCQAIGTKWVFRKKKDERGIVVKNKARLVASGFILKRKVYQMDVKSAFQYGKIEEEVYVCQPPGFEDPHFLDKVYKVEKALYGLYQAPRAWYETLSTYLLENGFHRGEIDITLFIKRHKYDILLVQVYVDDIIFRSTKKHMSNEFETLMHDKFQMSSIGELSFFLGLQVKQKSDGIFISQDKYMAKILKKFILPQSRIRSLNVLTALDPRHFSSAVCACARFQVTLKTSHLNAVKRIFRYLKGQLKFGLWYLEILPFPWKLFLIVTM
ncbi:putative ribonuclease H-like domain-containing protein [Tanacetum coccineum]